MERHGYADGLESAIPKGEDETRASRRPSEQVESHNPQEQALEVLSNFNG
jgi:hypothetical protein